MLTETDLERVGETDVVGEFDIRVLVAVTLGDLLTLGDTVPDRE